MKDTQFNPSPQDYWKIAPTEFDVRKNFINLDHLRGLIQGVVHDPTAYLFGGVAGHAGLFSTLADLIKYMRIHLSGGQVPGDIRIYPKTTVDLFSAKVTGLPYNNTRALGWDTIPVQTYPPCGHKFSPNSFGHTGFTGTSIWADKDKDLLIVILTNRVHPTAAANSHIKARSDISDAIVDALGL